MFLLVQLALIVLGASVVSFIHWGIRMVAGGLQFLPSVILSALAAIVASEAILTALHG